MNRRKFLSYVGCGCCGFVLNSCTSAPITERKQLKIISESKLNAQAAQIYEQVKDKEKMSKDKKKLNEIKDIGKKIENSIGEYFYRSKLDDPTLDFNWEYILIDNKKVRNAWCMPGGKIAVYTGILDVTKNTNGDLGLVMKNTSIARRQDVPDSFDISTVAYVARPTFILSSCSMWQGKVRGVEVPQERAIDIDTYVDYQVANFLKQKIMQGTFE